MPRRRTTRALLGCGVVAPPLFVLVFTATGALRTGYDPTYHPVSALSLGDLGWIQITNFVVTGLLLVAFAVGLRRALGRGRGSWWGPALLGTFALALVLSGVFVMDPMLGFPPGAPPGLVAQVSWHHTLHDLAGVAVFVSLPLACFVVARRFAAPPARPGWVAYCILTGVAGLVLLVAFGTAWEADLPFAGLVQRALIVVGWTWVTLLALRLRADLPPANTPGRPTT